MIDQMIENREVFGIPEDNQYLFPNKFTMFDGSKVMREFPLKCGAKEPLLMLTFDPLTQITSIRFESWLLGCRKRGVDVIARILYPTFQSLVF